MSNRTFPPTPIYRTPNQNPLPAFARHSHSTPEEQAARAERMKAEAQRLKAQGWKGLVSE